MRTYKVVSEFKENKTQRKWLCFMAKYSSLHNCPANYFVGILCIFKGGHSLSVGILSEMYVM